MRAFSDLISGLFTLFFIGAIIYGALKEGYVWQTLLVIGLFAIFLYLWSIREENIEKSIQQKLVAEKKEKYNEKFNAFKVKMYSFAHENERLTLNVYDIEEGGQYLSEFDKDDTKRIDDIIEKHVPFPKENFEQSIAVIKDSILKLSKRSKKSYIGF
jgi:hypothetical protein